MWFHRSLTAPIRNIILAVVVFLLTSLPAVAEKRIALIVGNSSYQNVPRLNNPANDARLMADTLRSLGFSLVGAEAQIDLDKASFDSAVRSFGQQLQGADVGLFYYAGHGLQVRGANYLVPVNANPVREADLDFELEDVGLVLRQMEGSGTRLNLVFLDACRNNPFGGRGLRATDTGLAQMRAPEGTLISFATQPGSVAQDGSDGHSPFTGALARTIRKPGLGIFDALNEVGLAVKATTGGEQQPWFSTSPINGKFYFATASGALQPSPLPTSTPTVITAPPRPSDEIECRSVGAHLNGEPVSIIRRVRLLEGQLHVSGTIGSEQSPERSLPCKPINTGVYCERAFGPVTITIMTKKDSMIESVTDQAGKEQAGAAYACDRPISFAPAAISLSPTTSKQPQAAAMLKPAPVPARQPYQAASPAPAPAPLVLPKAISPKYASEDFGQARMHTCLEQYIANKTTNSNGGMKWIEGGGGYYSACNKNLK